VNIFGRNTNKRLAQFQCGMEQTVSHVHTIEARLCRIEQKLALDVSDVNARLAALSAQLKNTVAKLDAAPIKELSGITKMHGAAMIEHAERLAALEGDLMHLTFQLEVDAAEADQMDHRVSALEEHDLDAQCDAYTAALAAEPVPVVPVKRSEWMSILSNYIDARRAAGTSSSIDEDDVVALLGLTDPVSQNDQRRIRSIFELLGFSFRADTEPPPPVAPEVVAEPRSDWVSILSKYSEEQMAAGNRGVDTDEVLRLLGLTDPVSAEDQNHIREILGMLGYREEPPAAPADAEPMVVPESEKQTRQRVRPRVVAYVKAQIAAGRPVIEDDILGRPIGGSDRKTMRRIFAEFDLVNISGDCWVPYTTHDVAELAA
jgi:hypothetical protein